MSDEDHFVEVLQVFGTGDADDGWHTEPGWRADERPFFLATCWCGWESPMREIEGDAFEMDVSTGQGWSLCDRVRIAGRFPA